MIQVWTRWLNMDQGTEGRWESQESVTALGHSPLLR